MLKQYLKQYRVKHNLTQEQMADKLNSSQSYYSQIESGSKKPGFNMVNKLSDVLDVTPEFIRGLL